MLKEAGVIQGQNGNLHMHIHNEPTFAQLCIHFSKHNSETDYAQ